MSEIIEITTTLGSESDASTLARQLVDSRLAACVQITGPIQSVYRWKGEICVEQEWRCSLKSISSLTQRLIDFIHQHHRYEVPEILVTSTVPTDTQYAAWVREQVEGV